MLVDRKQVVVAGYGGERWGAYEHALFSPDYGLDLKEINSLTGWDKPFEQRVTEAKRLIAEAGYPSGLKLKMPVETQPQMRNRAVLMADVWKKNLNVESDISSQDKTVLLDMRDKGDFHVFWGNTMSFVGDPDEIMGYFVGGRPSNFIGYSSSVLDKLADQQAREMDLAKRKQLVQQAERTILTDMAVSPQALYAYMVGWWPWVKGFVVQKTGYGSNFVFEHVWIDK